jgi:hypothetical protein
MQYPVYGWSKSYPLEALTVSATADRRGISNLPDAQSAANLSMLSNFLKRIPFDLTITSAYRSPETNTAVKGAKRSQHMTGLAVDMVPSGVTNKQLAEWFFRFRAKFPELDQVIWYRDTNHLHVGICPRKGVGCIKDYPRGEFFAARKEGSQYVIWAPTASDLAQQAALFAANRPIKTVGAIILTSSLIGVASLTTLGVVYYLWRRGDI